MTAPRVYMAGAVEGLPDLGTGWRRDLAAELVAAGCEPVWPTLDLYAVEITNGEMVGVAEARARWSAEAEAWRRDPRRRPPIDECFASLSLSDVVLVRWCADVGSGTRAEIAYAVAIGLPVVVWLHDWQCVADRWDELVQALGCVASTEHYTLGKAIGEAFRLGFERVRNRVKDKS